MKFKVYCCLFALLACSCKAFARGGSVIDHDHSTAGAVWKLIFSAFCIVVLVMVCKPESAKAKAERESMLRAKVNQRKTEEAKHYAKRSKSRSKR